VSKAPKGPMPAQIAEKPVENQATRPVIPSTGTKKFKSVSESNAVGSSLKSNKIRSMVKQ